MQDLNLENDTSQTSSSEDSTSNSDTVSPQKVSEMISTQLALRLAVIENILIKKNIISLDEIESSQEEVLSEWAKVFNHDL